MKIITENSTDLVIYFFDDTDIVEISEFGMTGKTAASDIKPDTHSVVENVTDFDDKIGGKYQFLDGQFVQSLTYVEPTIAPAYVEPAPKKTLSPIEFKLRFTAPERVAIYQSTDLIVKDFVSLIDDVRLTQVDLTLQSTIDAVGYLAEQGLIEQTRVSEILA